MRPRDRVRGCNPQSQGRVLCPPCFIPLCGPGPAYQAPLELAGWSGHSGSVFPGRACGRPHAGQRQAGPQGHFCSFSPCHTPGEDSEVTGQPGKRPSLPLPSALVAWALPPDRKQADLHCGRCPRPSAHVCHHHSPPLADGRIQLPAPRPLYPPTTLPLQSQDKLCWSLRLPLLNLVADILWEGTGPTLWAPEDWQGHRVGIRV